ncbi:MULTISPECIES: GNAT family N-acetyltransferase [unclassified Streptomyces]|uniref:GNAT family N-acetyltransferase n=1 Tax=unclassified Streptomyces TaxID=2593676 RepID=UPI000DAF274A|nr:MULTISPECIES: GNAT family N-acetyltransferase [unclassified Streptomyces]PZT72066.1 GNAT family N-acetyltransferase [Streptomyces sp. AC1-42T]PZT81611.1 GNAT family N-acetyltransferase [Streptomyces sp. AC1-42W]
MEATTLTTDRLRLRPFGPEDTEAVYEACQDPDILRWVTVPSPYTRSDAEFFTERLCPEGWRDGSMYNFAVLGEDGALTGALGITRRTLAGTYEIGYWTVKERRGRGYMTEAVLCGARWAFTSLGCDRLEWRAEVGNVPSRAVALRAGFHMEGEQRSGLLNKGVRRDTWVGALLPSDLGLPGTEVYVPAGAAR